MRISPNKICFTLLIFLFCTPLTVVHGDTLAFKVGKVVTFDESDRVINNATVIVKDGKIAEIGKSKDVKIVKRVIIIQMQLMMESAFIQMKHI